MKKGNEEKWVVPREVKAFRRAFGSSEVDLVGAFVNKENSVI